MILGIVKIKKWLLQLMRIRRLNKSKKKKPRKKSQFWVRNIFQLREEHGKFHKLIKELREKDRCLIVKNRENFYNFSE